MILLIGNENFIFEGEYLRSQQLRWLPDVLELNEEYICG